MPAGGHGFAQTVKPGGYAWWYVDALSEDGTSGITVIAFVGSVFSPYYARARRSGNADPTDHCALNVALYRPSAKLWAMTERGRDHVTRADEELSIGPSTLTWRDGMLTISIDEIAVPIPRRVRGEIRVRPEVVVEQSLTLDSKARHFWHPLAPRAHVEVAMDMPDWQWRGTGYLDGNSGSEPLEAAFAHWTWSRASLPDRTALQYEVTERAGTRTAMALEVDNTGRLTNVPVPPLMPLPRTRWRLPRTTRSDAPPRVLRTLEDTPFYARASLATDWRGQQAVAVHEFLSLDRFGAPVVQMMLPFRMPRRA